MQKSSIKEIPIKPGYEIKLVSQNPNKVKILNDNEEQIQSDNLKINQGTSIFVITYDGLTNKFSINRNIQQAYENSFKNRIGEKNINDFINKDSNHKKFIDWILSNPTALMEYLQGGYATNNIEDMSSYQSTSYQYKNKLNKNDELKALNIWFNIWNKYPKSHEGVDLKIAIATSLEFANGVDTWLTGSLIDPISRYKFYEDAYSRNKLMSDFYNYDVKTIRNIVNTKASNDDIQWLRNYMEKNHPDMINRDDITTGYNLIKYTDTNPYGKSVFGPDFYGKNPTIEKVIEYGGVCGAISKFSSILAQTFGVPAYPIGQPGHCAFVYLNSKHNYSIGYDIYGWKKSAGYNVTLPYMFINNVLSNNMEKYSESYSNMILANNSLNKYEALKLINLAIKEEPLNYEAWKIKLQILLSDPSTKQSEIVNIINELNYTFSEYPTIKNDILFQTNKKNIDFRFLGLGDWNNIYANLSIDFTTNTISLQTYDSQPHVYFNNKTYEKIEILDENNKIIYTKNFIGDEMQKSNLKEIPMKLGYKIRLTSQEPNRIKIFNNNDNEVNDFGEMKTNMLFNITKNGLELLH